MKYFLTLYFLTLLTATAAAQGTEVHFKAADGITVYGDIYRNDDTPLDAPLILLFHQAGGDARGEYGPLVDRLLAQGYIALAIDQRNGGGRFGGVNRTIADLDGAEFTYCEAYPDLEAALAYAVKSGFTGKRAVWGSSYSAALVFKLGAEHPDEVDAVLGFSPASGEALADCRPEDYSQQLKVPVLALRPIKEMEHASAAAQLKTFKKQGLQTYIADPGVHGSSMLNAELVGASTDETWAVVLEFLDNSLGEKVRTPITFSNERHGCLHFFNP